MSNFATEILAMRKLRQRRLRQETLEERRLLTGGRVVNDLIALYTFDAGAGDTVSDVSGIGEALDSSRKIAH